MLRCTNTSILLPRCYREGLIRVAFQSLQLVVTDFLPLMPCTCIKVVVDVAGKFGLQPQELNISLTAIGLLVGYRSGPEPWLFYCSVLFGKTLHSHWSFLHPGRNFTKLHETSRNFTKTSRHFTTQQGEGVEFVSCQCGSFFVLPCLLIQCNRPFSIYYDSNLAPRLGGTNQRESHRG